MKNYVAIVECMSNGKNYLQDIQKRGLSPLIIYPKLLGEAGLFLRSHVRDILPSDIPVIDAPENIDELLEMLKPYDIVAVVAGSEFGVELTDLLAQRLHLPGNNPETSIRRRNKAAMQEAVANHGLRAIRSRVVSSRKEAEEYYEELGSKKVVIKPLASAGTLGLHFCESKDELTSCLDLVMKEEDMFGTKNDTMLMQEFIVGTEYIVNTVSCNGVHRVTDIWVYNKKAVGNSGNAYNYARLVTQLNPGYKELVEYAYNVLDALDVKYGPVHGEFFIDENGPVLVEIGARPMGSAIDAGLMERSLGHHITDCALETYLSPEEFEKARYAPYRPTLELLIKYFISPANGSVTGFPVLPLLKRLESYECEDIQDVRLSGEVEKTVDLLTTPGSFQLCHADSALLMREYQYIRTIEKNSFGLLFSDAEAGEPGILDTDEVCSVYQTLPTGAYLTLVDSDEECMKLSALGIEAVSVEKMDSVSNDYDGGIFAISGKWGSEKCFEIYSAFLDTFNPGALIKIIPRSYESLPYKSSGYEWITVLANAEIVLPMYGADSCLTMMVTEHTRKRAQ